MLYIMWPNWRRFPCYIMKIKVDLLIFFAGDWTLRTHEGQLFMFQQRLLPQMTVEISEHLVAHISEGSFLVCRK